jgi:hypothetical protein
MDDKKSENSKQRLNWKSNTDRKRKTSLPRWEHPFRCQKRVKIRREEPARIYKPSLSSLKRWFSTPSSPKSLNSQIYFSLSSPLKTHIFKHHHHLLSTMQFSILTSLAAAATLSLVSASPAPGAYAIKPNVTTIVSTQTVTSTVTATLPVPTIPAPCTVCLVFEGACIAFCLAGGPVNPFCDACVGAQMEIMILCLEVSF